jgi:CheY-like chemotaxis protein
MEKKYKILLIDDNPGDARLTVEVIKECRLEEDINFDIISDSEFAMDFLLKKAPYENAIRPDIILLDLNLPKKNGIEVLKEVKAHPSLKTIPIIMMTTSNAEFDLKSAYENGANAYVVKPPDFDKLIKTMECIINFWFRTVHLPVKN